MQQPYPPQQPYQQGQYPPQGFPAQYPQDPNQYPVAGQPVYGSQPMGQPGQPGYGQQGFQPAYGQPQYGQPQPIYGQPMGVIAVDPMQQLPSSADGKEFAAEIRCPFCNQVSRTRLEYEAGSGTYQACCLLLCVTGFCWFLPFCMDDCKDRVHHCGSCSKYVGKKAYKLC